MFALVYLGVSGDDYVGNDQTLSFHPFYLHFEFFPQNEFLWHAYINFSSRGILFMGKYSPHSGIVRFI